MINTYSLEQLNEWKKIVGTFKHNDIYYLPEYVTSFKENGDGEPILIYYINDKVEAINVVIKRDISKIEKFKGKIKSNSLYDFITPYGYGGILFKDEYTLEERSIFINEYFEYCRNQDIITEFIRFHPVLKNHLYLNKFIDISEIGPTIAINTENYEECWDNFTSKNRNVIRKSIKNGIVINWGLSKELLLEFRRIYFETMNQVNADQYYYFSDYFFDSLLIDLRYKMLFFYARYNEKIISMSMIIFHNGNAHYHLSASDINYRHLAPTNLLLSEVVRYASENNIKSLHLGGGVGGQKDKLYSFKKAFSRLEDNRFFVGKIVFNQNLYEKLVNGIEKQTFFPLYRSN